MESFVDDLLDGLMKQLLGERGDAIAVEYSFIERIIVDQLRKGAGAEAQARKLEKENKKLNEKLDRIKKQCVGMIQTKDDLQRSKEPYDCLFVMGEFTEACRILDAMSDEKIDGSDVRQSDTHD